MCPLPSNQMWWNPREWMRKLVDEDAKVAEAAGGRVGDLPEYFEGDIGIRSDWYRQHHRIGWTRPKNRDSSNIWCFSRFTCCLGGWQEQPRWKNLAGRKRSCCHLKQVGFEIIRFRIISHESQISLIQNHVGSCWYALYSFPLKTFVSNYLDNTNRQLQ